MSLEYPFPNTTICPDTPENWREFWGLKARVMGCSIGDAQDDFYQGWEQENPCTDFELSNSFPRAHGGKHKKTAGEKANEALQLQQSKENQWLREMSRFLPGHEPDR